MRAQRFANVDPPFRRRSRSCRKRPPIATSTNSMSSALPPKRRMERRSKDSGSPTDDYIVAEPNPAGNIHDTLASRGPGSVACHPLFEVGGLLGVVARSARRHPSHRMPIYAATDIFVGSIGRPYCLNRNCYRRCYVASLERLADALCFPMTSKRLLSRRQEQETDQATSAQEFASSRPGFNALNARGDLLFLVGYCIIPIRGQCQPGSGRRERLDQLCAGGFRRRCAP